MKAKFVGGPYHGKTKDVNPTHAAYNGIRINEAPRLPYAALADAHTSMVSHKTHIYQIRMMGVTINGRRYSAPAMHPDGSIFLVHEDYKEVIQ